MFYIGHFSFDEMGDKQDQRHGYFTCIVNSEDVDSAVEKFKTKIEKTKTEKEIFARIVNVYIEDVFEIKTSPDTAIMLRMQSSEGEFPKSVSVSLPFYKNQDIAAYGWKTDVCKIKESGEDDFKEMDPFISFE